MHYHGIHKASSTTIRSIGLDYCIMPNGSTVGFKSWAKAADCVEVATNVRMRSTPVVHRKSVIPQTFGMEGSVTGACSGKPIHGPATPAADAKTVKTERGELVRHDQLWDLNAANCKGIACHEDAIVVEIDVDRKLPPGSTEHDYGRKDKDHDPSDKSSVASRKGIPASDVHELDLGLDGAPTSSGVPSFAGKSDVTLIMHGSDLSALGPEKLATLLKANGFSGGSIDLISCNGVSRGTAAKLDAELAKLGIEADITAYDGYTTIKGNGQVWVGVTVLGAMDEWWSGTPRHKTRVPSVKEGLGNVTSQNDLYPVLEIPASEATKVY